MDSNKIVFVGDFQAATLASIFRVHPDRPPGQSVGYVDGRASKDTITKTVISADLVVAQLQGPPQAKCDDAKHPKWVFFPKIDATFLWPFCGQAHPLMVDATGPYPPHLGDVILNQMIARAVPPEEAVDRYMALDVNTHVDLDRLFELCMNRQRCLDEHTGYCIAETIESYFRSEKLFLTPAHPGLRIFEVLFSALCSELNLATIPVEKVIASFGESAVFPLMELPIHPRVIEHFGIQYARRGSRYRGFDGGSYTFAEYALRYMKYEPNDDLREGLRLFQAGAHEDAIPRLRASLREGALSAEGYHALAAALAERGELDDAINNSRMALGLNARELRFQLQLSDLLIRKGDLQSAERVLRDSMAASPPSRRLHDDLAKLYLRQGRRDDAIIELRQAAAIGEPNPHVLAHLGNVLLSRGDLLEAEQNLRTAIQLEPNIALFHASMGRLLVRKTQIQEAILSYRNALELAPDNSDLRKQLEDLVARDEAARISDSTEQPILETAGTTALPSMPTNVSPSAAAQEAPQAATQASELFAAEVGSPALVEGSPATEEPGSQAGPEPTAAPLPELPLPAHQVVEPPPAEPMAARMLINEMGRPQADTAKGALWERVAKRIGWTYGRR